LAFVVTAGAVESFPVPRAGIIRRRLIIVTGIFSWRFGKRFEPQG
jgi:hypothetical protein